MRKLIKKYNGGGSTGNMGAADMLTITEGKTPSFAPKIDIDSLIKMKPNFPIVDTAIGKGGFFKNIGNFGKNIFKSMGPGAISMGSNVLNSLLPEATQSNGLQGINTVLGFAENVPVIGLYAALAKLGINALNSLGGHTIASLNNGLEEQDALANTGGGYGDFMADWDEAKQYSGKRAGLFDGNKYDEMIWDANYNMSKLQGIMGQLKVNNTLTALMADRWNQRTMMSMNGGPGNIMFGRLGLKVEILPKVHAILNNPKAVDFLTEFKEEVPEFKDGGKMNVIPEGSLHARLHHMENAEGLTKKGIPVVSIAKGGEIELQAEIELNEIIFNLEVTTELEKLMNDGSDNAAIEAGKLLVKEIFENTDDRTGLIKDLEPEKKESTTEDIVKNHQVFLLGGNIKPSFEEWYKTVPNDRNNIENYNLKRAYELAPWEELERWRTATPELLSDDKYHLKTFYWNDKGEGEFVKKNGHPTLIKELEAYFANKDFREKYDLDMSGDYFKYIKKK